MKEILLAGNAPENPFPSPPAVTLINRTASVLPADNFSPQEWQDLNSGGAAVAQSARTCYSKNIRYPEEYARNAEESAIGRRVAESTRRAGHLTTRQHTYYTFGLEGISRYLAWTLHAHPFYNSSQQSQRYVSMSPEGLMLPRLEKPRLNEVMKQAGEDLVGGYHRLGQILTPVALKLYQGRFPARKGPDWQKRAEKEAQKKAQEVARYLLPLGFKTNLWQTVSLLTLMRLRRLSEVYQTNPEAKLVIRAMVDRVAAVDPEVLAEFADPLPPEQTPEYEWLARFSPADRRQVAEVDKKLAGKAAKLDLNQSSPGQTLAEAVRLTLGIPAEALSDPQAVNLVLNPAKNPLLASTLGEMAQHQLSQTLNQVNLSALVSLSLTADAQLQRHRGLHHTRPILPPLPRLEEDIVIPALLNHSPEGRDLYMKLQKANLETIGRLLEAGLPPQTAAYLQTNAVRIRKRVSGPLGYWHHFFRLRTCLNAQEEIYRIAVSLVRQLEELDPAIARPLARPAPCGQRFAAGLKPPCPEGGRFCGVTIWKSEIDDYPERGI